MKYSMNIPNFSQELAAFPRGEILNINAHYLKMTQKWGKTKGTKHHFEIEGNLKYSGSPLIGPLWGHETFVVLMRLSK